MVGQNLTADEHNSVHAGPEKTVNISPFARDKKMGQKASQETEAGAMMTCHDRCQLKKCLTIGVQPPALIQLSPCYRLKEVLETDRRFPAAEEA
jgi:hypothetical protein